MIKVLTLQWSHKPCSSGALYRQAKVVTLLTSYTCISYTFVVVAVVHYRKTLHHSRVPCACLLSSMAVLMHAGSALRMGYTSHWNHEASKGTLLSMNSLTKLSFMYRLCLKQLSLSAYGANYICTFIPVTAKEFCPRSKWESSTRWIE